MQVSHHPVQRRERDSDMIDMRRGRREDDEKRKHDQSDYEELAEP